MSGRFAAQTVVEARSDQSTPRAGERYSARIRERFARRLAHRVALMRYLEQRPRRYGVLFTQLAQTRGLAEVLLKEDCDRTLRERLYLYRQGLRFGLRSFACRD